MSPKYIGPYEIIKMLNPVAYRLDLPVELKHAQNVFHISQLKNDVPDIKYVIMTKSTDVAETLVYEGHPVHILDYSIKHKASL